MNEKEIINRVNYLDALRGIGAVQVLLLHFLSSFAPKLVHAWPAEGTLAAIIRASPLFFLYDGTSAVYMFFTLSGYVLTVGFAGSIASFGNLVVRRVIRLSVPILASAAFASAMFMMFAGANIGAGQLVGSDFLSAAWQPSSSTWFVTDAIVNGLLVGYRDVSPSLWVGVENSRLPSIMTSLNSPLWTMPIEFYGSILIFLFIRQNKFSNLITRIFWLVVFFIFIRTPMVCFLAGSVAARYRLASIRPVVHRIVPAGAIIAGLFLTNRSDFWTAGILKAVCQLDSPIILPCLVNPMFLQKEIGAMLIVFGITQSLTVRTWLNNPRLHILGRISFPLYLVHWPILYGLSSYLLILTAPRIGLVSAQIAALGVGILVSIAAAMAFMRVDRLAMTWSRRYGTRTEPHVLPRHGDV